MTDTSNAALLVELLTEELPPKALARLSDAFAHELAEKLADAGLTDLASTAAVTQYATPRRLAVLIPNVRATAPEQLLRTKILPVTVALDTDGQPTAALRKKLTALGFPELRIEQLERAADGKTEAFFFSHHARGATLRETLQTALNETLAKLPIPKVMHYQRPDGTSVKFARPAHSLIALHGDTVVPVTALGLPAGRSTQGHRFLSTGAIEIKTATAYETALHRAHVQASYSARRENIRSMLLAAAGKDHVVMPDALLDEVTALVEWPAVYTCRFADEFLTVPQECLILTMQTNQKYFALTDAHGALRARFLVVSNIETPTPADIIEGNERVVRARLADAKFFFEQDRKKTLADRVPLLANVIYHNRLGSQLERTERVTGIALELSALLKSSLNCDPAQIQRAAHLAKADLLTEMVGEFPELQGTMGTYYARYDGETDEVASACSEHYQPRFSGDALPATIPGTIVALADKLETLTGIWGIGLAPTGEKDPFALRRHALGIVRILLEKAFPLEVPKLLRIAQAQFAALPAVHEAIGTALPAISTFLYERLRGVLRERGYPAHEIDAVLSQHPPRFDEVLPRLDAVHAFAALPQASALAEANKRIGNILKKSSADLSNATVHVNLLREPAEQALYQQLHDTVTPAVQQHLNQQNYRQALTSLAQLQEPVAHFFNDVMVNAEDAQLRANRLALLSELHAQMNCVADISRLAMQGG